MSGEFLWEWKADEIRVGIYTFDPSRAALLGDGCSLNGVGRNGQLQRRIR